MLLTEIEVELSTMCFYNDLFIRIIYSYIFKQVVELYLLFSERNGIAYALHVYERCAHLIHSLSESITNLAPL
jgi:hypothetical protein